MGVLQSGRYGKSNHISTNEIGVSNEKKTEEMHTS